MVRSSMMAATIELLHIAEYFKKKAVVFREFDSERIG